MSDQRAMDALRDVNFDWVRRLSDIWHDDAAHVPEINREAFAGVLESFERTRQGGPQPGRVVAGSAGSGKTHLLGALRAAVAEQGWFVIVDMTDVRDFWETVLQGYLESLQERLPDGRTQFQALLSEVLGHLAPDDSAADYERATQELSGRPLPDIARLAKYVISKRIAPRYPSQAREFQDVLRALLLLNADDFDVSSRGHSWLVGVDLLEAEHRECGFTGMRRNQKHVVQGLSWLMSLTRPTLLALDQLDAISAQCHVASPTGASAEQSAAWFIVQSVGNGLLALHDMLHRSLTLLSCQPGTWQALTQLTNRAVVARFNPDLLVLLLASGVHGRQMVEARLANAYRKHAFQPPYPSWPFQPQAFEGAAGRRSPREILIDCSAHRDRCIASGSISELERFSSDTTLNPVADAFEAVSQRFQHLVETADTLGLISYEGGDTKLGDLIAHACICAVREVLAVADRDLIPEIDFPGRPGAQALHARLRIVEHSQAGRERHYCFRALNQGSPMAFLARLKAATTASGITSSLSFRRLVIVRNRELPGGEKTQALINSFIAAGGRFTKCTDDDLKQLMALKQLCVERPAGLDDWLRRTRPASALSFLQESGFVADIAQSVAAAEATDDGPSPMANSEPVTNGEDSNHAAVGAPAPPEASS
jgi:hypothetical protein